MACRLDKRRRLFRKQWCRPLMRVTTKNSKSQVEARTARAKPEERGVGLRARLHQGGANRVQDQDQNLVAPLGLALVPGQGLEPQIAAVVAPQSRGDHDPEAFHDPRGGLVQVQGQPHLVLHLLLIKLEHCMVEKIKSFPLFEFHIRSRFRITSKSIRVRNAV